RGAGARPRVREVDLLARPAVEPELRHAPRGADPHDVPELPPAECPVAAANVVVDVAELHEAVQPCVHAEAGLDLAADERAGAIDLTIGIQERSQAGDRAGRPECPPGEAERLPIPDLRHEPGVRAKLIAQVLVEPERV